MQKTFGRFVAAFALLASLAPADLTQTYIPNPETGFGPSGRLGTSVAIFGDRMAIGAPTTGTAIGSNVGLVAIYHRNGSGVWLQESTISTGALTPNTYFGDSVAMNADTLVVGAPRSNSTKGSVFVFTRTDTTWSLQATLARPVSANGDLFGNDVAFEAIDATTTDLIVGAPGRDVLGTDSGSVYVYKRGNGSYSSGYELTASDGAAGDKFGTSVAIAGRSFLVGAPAGSTMGIESGSAYYFTRGVATDYTQQAELGPIGSNAGDNFGLSVSLTATHAAVGAPDAFNTATDAGKAFVFTKTGSTWSAATLLTDPAPESQTRFGECVYLDGDNLLIGAPRENGTATASGGVYEFTNTGGTWSVGERLFASDGGGQNAYFGTSVAKSGAYSVVGAIGWGDETTGALGAAYCMQKVSGAWTGGQKLAWSGSPSGDAFGSSVAVSATTTLIGAPLDNGPGLDSGSATFVEAGGLTTRVTPPDGYGGDKFGFAVAMEGDYAVIGAPLDDDRGTNSGTAYIYKRTAGLWAYHQKLIPTDGISYDHFGEAVAISGNYIIIGAPFDNAPLDNTGSAYIFARSGTTWTQEAKLTPIDAVAQKYYGTSVAISGLNVLIGARGDSDSGADAGAAYVHQRLVNGTWQHVTKLTPPPDSGNQSFGYSVAVHDFTYVVGVPYGSDAIVGSGNVVVYERSGNSFTALPQLDLGDVLASDAFGWSVAVTQDSIVIGAPRDNLGSVIDTGAAYLYRRYSGGWYRANKMQPATSLRGDAIGNAVAVFGDRIAVGAYLDDTAYNDPGGAYLFLYSASSVSGSWDSYE